MGRKKHTAEEIVAKLPSGIQHRLVDGLQLQAKPQACAGIQGGAGIGYRSRGRRRVRVSTHARHGLSSR
ncbi:hypothetical protein OFEAOIEE_LOCUS3226 [Methylorubrum extorquens]